jgi:hypothetical protein
MALMTALGSLLGAKNSSLSNRTSTETSTSTPSYTPGQTGLQDQLLQTISGGLKDPSADFAPVEAAGISSINKAHDGILANLNRVLASRGFTSSGTTALNTGKLFADRAGAVGDFEGQLAAQKMARRSSLLSDALTAAYKPASTTTSTVGVAPGNTGTGALSGGLTALLAQLNQAYAGQAYAGGY